MSRRLERIRIHRGDPKIIFGLNGEQTYVNEGKPVDAPAPAKLEQQEEILSDDVDEFQSDQSDEEIPIEGQGSGEVQVAQLAFHPE